MTAFSVFVNIVSIGILMMGSTIFYGYVLSVLWKWFIVPTFGTPILGVVPAIGITIVMSCLARRRHDCEEEKKAFKDKMMEGVSDTIITSTIALFFGWIVHLFM